MDQPTQELQLDPPRRQAAAMRRCIEGISLTHLLSRGLAHRPIPLSKRSQKQTLTNRKANAHKPNLAVASPGPAYSKRAAVLATMNARPGIHRSARIYGQLNEKRIGLPSQASPIIATFSCDIVYSSRPTRL